jgi:hypothetical protein
MSDASLIVPGLVHVGVENPSRPGALVQMGTAVGWTIARGIATWRRELTVVLREEITADLVGQLGVVLPEQQGEPHLVPRATRAARASKLVAVEGGIADALLANGLRLHTVGFESVSNGFYYFAQGGGAAPRRIQGGLIEMIAPSLGAAATNEELEARLDGLIDRLLAELSEGILSEAQVELAEALPVLAPKTPTGAARLQGLEGALILAESRSGKLDAEARAFVEAVRGATLRGEDRIQVPLFGEAWREAQPELEVEFTEGDAGQHLRMTLPARSRWFVSGKPTSAVQPAAKPVAAGPDRAAERAAAERAAAERAVAERAAAERAAAERAAAERTAAERAAAERAAAERATAARAAAQRAAEQRAAAERAVAERAAADRARAAEQAAAQRAAEEARLEEERRAAERAAAEQAAMERAEAERAAAERAAAERAAMERAAEEAAAQAKKAAAPAESEPEVPIPLSQQAISKIAPKSAARPVAKRPAKKKQGWVLPVLGVLVLAALVAVFVMSLQR